MGLTPEEEKEEYDEKVRQDLAKAMKVGCLVVVATVILVIFVSSIGGKTTTPPNITTTQPASEQKAAEGKAVAIPIAETVSNKDLENDFNSALLYYDHHSYKIKNNDATIIISLPDTYNKYIPGTMEIYKEMLINDSAVEAYMTVSDMFYSFGDVNKIDITVTLHNSDILNIKITRDEWNKRDMDLDQLIKGNPIDRINQFNVTLLIK